MVGHAGIGGLDASPGRARLLHVQPQSNHEHGGHSDQRGLTIDDLTSDKHHGCLCVHHRPTIGEAGELAEKR
jgi:hypothetical protein